VALGQAAPPLVGKPPRRRWLAVATSRVRSGEVSLHAMVGAQRACSRHVAAQCYAVLMAFCVAIPVSACCWVPGGAAYGTCSGTEGREVLGGTAALPRSHHCRQMRSSFGDDVPDHRGSRQRPCYGVQCSAGGKATMGHDILSRMCRVVHVK
jgi:hypothetical protein